MILHANFKSRCPICRDMIEIGDAIERNERYDEYAHYECETGFDPDETDEDGEEGEPDNGLAL